MKQRNYFNSDLTQNAKRACNSSTTQYFDFKTFLGSIENLFSQNSSSASYKEKFNISIGIQIQEDIQILGFQNLIVYVKHCVPTCRTLFKYYKLSNFFYGSLQLGGTLVFDADKNVKEITLQKDQKIYVYQIKEQNHSFHILNLQLSVQFLLFNSFKILQIQEVLHSSTKFVGSLLYSEGMSFQFANSQSLQFIRLKISFYIKSFQTDNKIQTILDDQIQGEIIKTSSKYTFDKIKKIIVRVSLALILMMQSGQRQYLEFILIILYLFQKENNQLLGFRNIIIDSDNLKRNFAVCGDFSTCQKCNTNYLLFQNGCVSTCSVHSSNCVNYSDTIANLFLDSCYLFSKRVIQFKYEYLKVKILPYPFLFIIDEVIESNEKVTIKINKNPIIALILLKISNGESKL
ncbi:unnamed protein product [Paramecium pentaurelia]|uniref:Uncharacterized protein n=1 Tax=Paramecium pentaurelia TaxID=43138 RepID=A0A8S1YHJ1_9CILI|nr:unnamed protein product [Paramecium pentaurelia]